VNTTRPYAGIGSRKTPPDIQALMTQCAKELFNRGYTLRSGGADGADTAFETGGWGLSEIFLPSAKFNNRVAGGRFIDSSTLPAWSSAIEMAKEFHPAPQKLTGFSLYLMARNCFQVLGADLQTPSVFVMCWTSSHAFPSGGTAQALRIAEAYRIPVVNLAVPAHVAHVHTWLLR
jgi:hypothetical protein